MQSTGQTSTQALSLTLMQGSAITYAIPASLVNPLLGNVSDWCSRRANSHILTNLSGGCQAALPGHTLSKRDRRLSPAPRAPPAISERPQLRIERVPERIAEEVEGEDRQADRESRKDRHPRRRFGEVHRCA